MILNALDAEAPVCHIDLMQVSANLGVAVNTDIRLEFLEEQQQKDPIYQEIMQAIGTGRPLKSLEATHPIIDLNLEYPELQIIKGRRLMTYQNKIYIPKPAVTDDKECQTSSYTP